MLTAVDQVLSPELELELVLALALALGQPSRAVDNLVGLVWESAPMAAVRCPRTW